MVLFLIAFTLSGLEAEGGVEADQRPVVRDNKAAQTFTAGIAPGFLASSGGTDEGGARV